MELYAHQVTPQYAQLMVEVRLMGVPTLRMYGGYAGLQLRQASVLFTAEDVAEFAELLALSFYLEAEEGTAKAVTAMRLMGSSYGNPAQQQDAVDFTNNQAALLAVQYQHLTTEQSGAPVSADRYSAFTDYASGLLGDDE